MTIGIVLGLAATAVGNLLLPGVDPWLAAAAGPVVGLLLGLVTGTVVVFGRMPAIVATIGLLGVYRTVIFVVLGESWLSGLPPTLGVIFGARLFGVVPVSLIVIAAAYAMAYVALRQTPFGLHLLAVGDNEERARLAGVGVKRVRLACYAISGALCGVPATFYVSTYRNVEMTVGSTLALDAIAAVVLGGTSIVGGRASLLGTALGVFLIRILQNGFTIIGPPSLWQPGVTGGAAARLTAAGAWARGKAGRIANERVMMSASANTTRKLVLLGVLFVALVTGFGLYNPRFLLPNMATTVLQFSTLLA